MTLALIAQVWGTVGIYSNGGKPRLRESVFAFRKVKKQPGEKAWRSEGSKAPGRGRTER